MKRTLLLLLAILTFWAAPAYASMMYYTLEGTVVEVSDSKALTDVQVGDAIYGTFGVDMDRLGLQYAAGDSAPEEVAGTFYATYAGGNLNWSANRPDMQDNWVQSGEWSDDLGVGYFLEYHNGLTVVASFEDMDFKVGQFMYGDYFVGTLSDYSASFVAELTVTDISETNPYAVSETPIPAAGWLLASGAIGLLGVRRRRRS